MTATIPSPTREQLLTQELDIFSTATLPSHEFISRRIFVFWAQADPVIIQFLKNYIDVSKAQKTGAAAALAFQCLIPHPDDSQTLPTSYIIGYLTLKGPRPLGTIRRSIPGFQNVNMRLLLDRVQLPTVNQHLVENPRILSWRSKLPPFIYNVAEVKATSLTSLLTVALPDDDERAQEAKIKCIEDLCDKMKTLTLRELLATQKFINKQATLKDLGRPSKKYLDTPTMPPPQTNDDQIPEDPLLALLYA